MKDFILFALFMICLSMFLSNVLFLEKRIDILTEKCEQIIARENDFNAFK